MTCDSLRDFLAILDQNGQLLRISDEVAPEPDLGAAGRARSGSSRNEGHLVKKFAMSSVPRRITSEVRYG